MSGVATNKDIPLSNPDSNGLPTSEGKEIDYSLSVYESSAGEMEVHSLTKQILDNHNVRYTLDFTSPESLVPSVFDPSKDLLWLILDRTSSGRQTLVFDVPLKLTIKINELTISFVLENKTYAYITINMKSN